MMKFLCLVLFGVFLSRGVSEATLEDIFEMPIEVQTVAEHPSFGWLESPLWSEKGQYLLFTDVKTVDENGETSGMIWRYDDDNGLTPFLKKAGIVGPGGAVNITGWAEAGPNGMIWGWNGDGDLLFCQHGKKRIARVNVMDVINGTVAPDKVTVVVDMFNGKPFNSPNDMTLLDGKLYFSDPPFGLQKIGGSPDLGLSLRTQPVSGIYMIPSEGAAPQLIIDDIPTPNGIAFSDVGNLFLAVTNSTDPHFRMYNISTNSFKKLPSVNRIDPAKNITFNLNDGMTALKDKNIIFGAGPAGVYVLDGTTGKEIGYIRIDDLVSNVGIGGGYLWVAANKVLVRIKLKEKQIPPPTESPPTKSPIGYTSSETESSGALSDTFGRLTFMLLMFSALCFN